MRRGFWFCPPLDPCPSQVRVLYSAPLLCFSLQLTVETMVEKRCKSIFLKLGLLVLTFLYYIIYLSSGALEVYTHIKEARGLANQEVMDNYCQPKISMQFSLFSFARKNEKLNLNGVQVFMLIPTN